MYSRNRNKAVGRVLWNEVCNTRPNDDFIEKKRIRQVLFNIV